MDIEDDGDILNLEFDETKDTLCFVAQDVLNADEAELEEMGWLEALDSY